MLTPPRKYSKITVLPVFIGIFRSFLHFYYIIILSLKNNFSRFIRKYPHFFDRDCHSVAPFCHMAAGEGQDPPLRWRLKFVFGRQIHMGTNKKGYVAKRTLSYFSFITSELQPLPFPCAGGSTRKCRTACSWPGSHRQERRMPCRS